MVFETIRKSSAPEMVVEQILDKLNTGKLQSGGRLPSQREMSLLFGVGRSSVREAINALALMGYLDVRQGKGTFIRKDLPSAELSASQLNAALKAGSFLDLMEAREILECKSVELAAERAEGKQIRRIKNALKKVEESDDDYLSFLKADLDFHVTLAEATENVVICEIMKLIIEKVVEHHSRFKYTLLTSDYRGRSIHSVKQIVACVEKGEAQKGAEWMRYHLNAIRPELKDIITEN
jgi:GntR family transcriptional repressor for pyruvate dehydrogenase complex